MHIFHAPLCPCWLYLKPAKPRICCPPPACGSQTPTSLAGVIFRRPSSSLLGSYLSAPTPKAAAAAPKPTGRVFPKTPCHASASSAATPPPFSYRSGTPLFIPTLIPIHGRTQACYGIGFRLNHTAGGKNVIGFSPNCKKK